MDIRDLKRALVEIHHLCRSKLTCKDCEFNTGEWYCPMRVCDCNGDMFAPEDWDIDEWRDDAHTVAEPGGLLASDSTPVNYFPCYYTPVDAGEMSFEDYQNWKIDHGE